MPRKVACDPRPEAEESEVWDKQEEAMSIERGINTAADTICWYQSAPATCRRHREVSFLHTNNMYKLLLVVLAMLAAASAQLISPYYGGYGYGGLYRGGYYGGSPYAYGRSLGYGYGGYLYG